MVLAVRRIDPTPADSVQHSGDRSSEFRSPTARRPTRVGVAPRVGRPLSHRVARSVLSLLRLRPGYRRAASRERRRRFVGTCVVAGPGAVPHQRDRRIPSQDPLGSAPSWACAESTNRPTRRSTGRWSPKGQYRVRSMMIGSEGYQPGNPARCLSSRPTVRGRNSTSTTVTRCSCPAMCNGSV